MMLMIALDRIKQKASVDLAEFLALDLVQLLQDSLLLRLHFFEDCPLLVAPFLLPLSE